MRCSCGRAVSFAAQSCPDCAAPLGFVPHLRELVALEPASKGGEYRVVDHDDQPTMARCANANRAMACNWMRLAHEPGSLCFACQLNVEQPDLTELEDDSGDWGAIETAKRRLLAQLMSLDLPIVTRSEDPEHGLGFALRRPVPGGEPVLTGHASGLITLNMDEANDARREQIRRDLHEPYRTLLGHFRHEIGHFYWDQLVANTQWLQPFRDLFGDERADYSEALARNYSEGPPSNWAEHHISTYASSHPWEDWAETWAHYLHVLDSLTTALAHGLDAKDVEMTRKPFTPEDLYDPGHPEAQAFLLFLNAWVEMIDVLNELSQSLGQPDAYPFELSSDVVRKLHFVHLVVLDARETLATEAKH
ncbi:MAG: putative zinc-binding metallopeptidase [Halieaceae bacterium]|nr:putative zinc-binding metallopeptidase [Halieaceae bacterium]